MLDGGRDDGSVAMTITDPNPTLDAVGRTDHIAARPAGRARRQAPAGE
jgi:hypothetical protein